MITVMRIYSQTCNWWLPDVILKKKKKKRDPFLPPSLFLFLHFIFFLLPFSSTHTTRKQFSLCCRHSSMKLHFVYSNHQMPSDHPTPRNHILKTNSIKNSSRISNVPTNKAGIDKSSPNKIHLNRNQV